MVALTITQQDAQGRPGNQPSVTAPTVTALPGFSEAPPAHQQSQFHDTPMNNLE